MVNNMVDVVKFYGEIPARIKKEPLPPGRPTCGSQQRQGSALSCKTV